MWAFGCCETDCGDVTVGSFGTRGSLALAAETSVQADPLSREAGEGISSGKVSSLGYLSISEGP